jgi:NAD(P)H-dependent FMN reductase
VSTTDRPLLQVLIASTRPGRVGEPTGRWVAQRAQEHAGFDVEVVDLAEIDLPMFAEPKHPRLGDYALSHTRRFSAIIGRADAFVFVFPEYNHSYNAALKNALDHLSLEWRGKPVGLVSYGGVAAGARAAVALEPVLLALGMRPVAFAPIPMIFQFLEGDEDERRFVPDAEVDKGMTALLDGVAAEVR